ncbi:MAG TPA: MFS transporter [Candidatus Lokiarchaeia archaeon]|nr:MFS transporter [Candidatus Lokiarchaeia archaeon]
MPEPKNDFRTIASLGLFRTISGGLIGTGAQLFILFYWTNSNFYSGLSASAIALTYIFSPTICGRISDRIGRKNALKIGTAGNFTIAFFYVLVVILVHVNRDTWLIWFIIVLRMFEGLANGFFWPILQASVSDVALSCCSDKEDFERISRSGITIYNTGWVSGSLIGQVLLSCITVIDLRLIDLVLILPVFSQGFNLFQAFKKFNVPQNQASNAPVVTEAIGPDAGKNHAPHANAPVIVAMLALALIFVYAFSQNALSTTTTNLYKAEGVAMLVGFTEAIRLACQAYASNRMKISNHKEIKLLILSGILAISFVAMAFFTNAFEVFSFMALYSVTGFLFGIIYGESMNLLVNSGASKKRGMLMGMFESFIGIATFIGPLLAGYLTQFSTYAASYLATAFVISSIVAFCAFLALRIRKNQHQIDV